MRLMQVRTLAICAAGERASIVYFPGSVARVTPIVGRGTRYERHLPLRNGCNTVRGREFFSSRGVRHECPESTLDP